MTPAQERFLRVLERHSAMERRKSDSGGWVEAWDVLDAWGTNMPVAFIANAGRRCLDRVLSDGLIEEHPEHRELIRPKTVADVR